MTDLVTQAAFARLKGVSRKTVTQWKGEGRIVMVDDLVDVKASQKKLEANTRPRATKARRPLASKLAGRAIPAPTTAKGNNPGDFVVLGLPPAGAHPLACNQAATADCAAAYAAELLLPLLPADNVRRLAEELATRLRAGAVACLTEDGIQPPTGVARWPDWIGFIGPAIPDTEWREMVAEFGQAAAAPAAGTSAKRRPTRVRK